MRNACLTINFQTKNICIDGKSITLEGLRQGDFHAEFSPVNSQWSIKLNTSYLSEPSDLIYARELENGLEFIIFFHSNFENHLKETRIFHRIRKHIENEIKIQNKTSIEILNTSWSKVEFSYHFRLGDIALTLTP